MRHSSPTGFLVAGLAAIALFSLLPAYDVGGTAIYMAIRLSVPLAVAYGILRHRPAPAAPWLAMVMAQTVYLAADAAWYGAETGILGPVGVPSLADALYLGAYSLMGLSVALLLVMRGGHRDLRSLADALVVALMVAVWVTHEAIVPLLIDESIALPARLVLASYPGLDVLITLLVAWLAFATGAGGVAAVLLLLGMLAQAAADSLFALSFAATQLYLAAKPFWLLGALLIGAAALHPSMARLGQPGERAIVGARGRLLSLGLASLAVMLLVLAESGAGHGSGDVLVKLGSLIMFGLVVLRMLGLLVDVDTHRRTEAEVRRLNEQLEERVAERTSELAATGALLRDVVSTVPAVIFRGAIGSEPEFLSSDAGALPGTAMGSALDGRGSWSEMMHPGDLAALMEAGRTARTAGRDVYTAEFRTRQRDGTWRWFLSTTRYVGGEAGRPTHYVGTAVDITERKAAEEALGVALDEAARANRAKTEFLSGVSHELRTPLNHILGFGQLLSMAELGDDDRDSVAHVLSAGRALLGMVDSLLDLSHVESGRVALSIEPVSVDEVLQEAAAQVRPRAAERAVDVGLPAPMEPALMVLADRGRIRQVVLTLLSNAVTHDREGGSVRVACEPLTGGRLAISVSDTGPGIPPELQATLFSPFEHRRSGHPRPGGLGIDLALAARLMAAMGGSIRVRSEMGAGSTFTIELPLFGPVAGEQPSAPAAGGSQPHQVTILYVDDDADNLGLVERIIQARPATLLLVAMRGRLGVEMARQRRPDLVLLDAGLPDIMGEQALALLKEDPATHAIPVVVLSSDPSDAAGRRMLELGAAATLPKPLDVALFLATVDRMLDGGPPPAG